MIPKAELLTAAKFQELLPTTIQKDYVLGWLLRAIGQHPVLSQWVFKGGTCLKKCFFETYRFSEDLDFTLPKDQPVSTSFLKNNLDEAVAWVESRCGLAFPRQDWKIEEYSNPQGKIAYQVKIPYSGPIGQHSKSLQRVKFDLTQDEVLVDAPLLRVIYHGYSDATVAPFHILCYSIDEILAEKTRALVQRHGRCRDVYDVVNISRNFRDKISADRTRKIAYKKFEFKGLTNPTLNNVIEAIDEALLKSNWNQELAHQINVLAPVESFLNELRDAVAWWLEPESANPLLQPMEFAKGYRIPREFFPIANKKSNRMVVDRIRYAAHSRLCAFIKYNGQIHLVEPYSIRLESTDNVIFHSWELEVDGKKSNSHKIFNINEIEFASVSNQVYVPKWEIEL